MLFLGDDVSSYFGGNLYLYRAFMNSAIPA